MTAKLLKIPRAINYDAIDKTEKLLAELKAGSAQAVGLAIVNADRSISTAYSFSDSLYPLTAAAAQLLHRLNEA